MKGGFDNAGNCYESDSQPQGGVRELRLKPNHLAQLRYQKKGPRYIQATPRTVLYRQSDIEDWLTANTVETEDSKEIKKASAATDARSNERRFK